MNSRTERVATEAAALVSADGGRGARAPLATGQFPILENQRVALAITSSGGLRNEEGQRWQLIYFSGPALGQRPRQNRRVKRCGEGWRPAAYSVVAAGGHHGHNRNRNGFFGSDCGRQQKSGGDHVKSNDRGRKRDSARKRVAWERRTDTQHRHTLTHRHADRDGQSCQCAV